MNVLKTVAAAFSMYSAVPMPQFQWDSRNMRYVFLAFPLVGALAGGLCWAWAWLCGYLLLPDLLRGAVLCLIPVLVTGGIHLDGYADTCDALASRGSAEKKREILKDPHIGTFAVIRLCAHFILTLALWTALKPYPPVPVLLSFCLSRVQSGLAVVSFPLAGGTGLARTFADAADKKTVRTLLIVLDVLLSAGLCFFGCGGIAMAAAAQAVFLYTFFMSKKQFGGFSGDLAGWFLVQAETWMLAALFAARMLEGLL